MKILIFIFACMMLVGCSDTPGYYESNWTCRGGDYDYAWASYGGLDTNCTRVGERDNMTVTCVIYDK